MHFVNENGDVEDSSEMGFKVLLLGAVILGSVTCVTSEALPPVPVSYSIREELNEGTLVGQLSLDAKLNEKYPTEVLKKLRFTYLGKKTLSFDLELNTGTIMTGEQIDREEICPMQETCEVKFDVAVQPMSYFQIIKVTIVVNDINDNWPQFPEPTVIHEILESAALGTTLPLPSAVDTDSPKYGIQDYKVVDDSGKFGIKITDKLDGSTDVKLILDKKLDREMKEEYNVRVIAFDGGGNSGNIDVQITVLDANDNNPMFYNNTYEVTILENVPLGTTILHIKAFDPDIGDNGKIHYGLSTRTKTKYGHLFSIDEVNGDITVTGEIDFEEHQVFHLGVTAEDMGPSSLPADATVIVHIKDENDNPPEITINTLTESTSAIAEVMEDSVVGTFVAHVTVVDKDSGINGRFNCFLNDNHFKLELVYKKEYQIVTALILDRETRDSYDILVECTDEGRKSQTSVKNLRILVGDKNDHPPQFDKAQYTANIVENNYEGTSILQVNATDKDLGRNADIRYVLPPEFKSFFNLDPNKGILTAAVRFDKEEYPEIRFKIIAEDHGEPPKTGRAVVLITVQDVNDNAPVFQKNQYTFSVAENEPLGSIVDVVTAEDKDHDIPNCNFTYSISYYGSDTESLEKFHLDQNTGSITTEVSLNRELTDVYHLMILAIDKGEPKNTGSVPVTIIVTDVNDNPPYFVFPNNTNRSVQVSSMAQVGYPITKVKAIDRDSGINAQLTYKITGGNSDHLFKLERKSGTLSTARRLHKTLHSIYVLELSVSDSGIHTAKSTLEVYINRTMTLPVLNGQNNSMEGFFSGYNLYIVIGLAAASALIAVILIVAIIFIHRRSRRDKDEGSYNCRQEEAKKILQNQSQNKDISTVKHSPMLVNGGATIIGNSAVNHYTATPTSTMKLPKKEVSFTLERGADQSAHTLPKQRGLEEQSSNVSTQKSFVIFCEHIQITHYV